MTEPAYQSWDPPLTNDGTLEALAAWQDGRCAICDHRGTLRLDHDHDTGLVRGWLCSSCNITESRYSSVTDLRFTAYRANPPTAVLGIELRYVAHRMTMIGKKAMTVRLDDELAARVEIIAKVHGIPIADAIREALEGYVAQQLGTDEFRAKLHATVEAEQRLLKENAQ